MKKETKIAQYAPSAIIGFILSIILTPAIGIILNILLGNVVFAFFCNQNCTTTNNIIYLLFIIIFAIVVVTLKTTVFKSKK